MPAAPHVQPPPQRTRKGERTAERILDAAEALFAERGYAGATLRDVAQAVGLRVPSLYNHFARKEELYEAVLERGIRPVLVSLAAFVDAPDDPERQRVVLEEVVDRIGRRPNIARLIQFEILTGGERLTPLLRERLGPILTQTAELVAQTPGARVWREEHLPHLVLAIFHVVVGYFTIAPFYRDLSGQDLLSKRSLAEQAAFLNELVNRLLPDDEG